MVTSYAYFPRIILIIHKYLDKMLKNALYILSVSHKINDFATHCLLLKPLPLNPLKTTYYFLYESLRKPSSIFNPYLKHNDGVLGIGKNMSGVCLIDL